MRKPVAVAVVALVVLAALGTVAAPSAAGTTGVAAQADCSYPVTMTDVTGTEVTVEEDPDRLVALAPSAAQILWAVGAQDEVVGMPQDYFTGYLNGTEGKTDIIQSDGTVITENVIDSEPDLVLAPNVTPNETVETLRESGLTVYKFDSAGSLDDVYSKIEQYGRLTGHYDEAGRVSADMQGQVQAIEEAVSDEENPSVYFDLGFGFTAGTNTFIGGVIESAGGDNIAGEIDGGFAELSQEVIAAEDPEWIIVNGKQGAMTRNPAINDSTAVEEGNIVRVNRNFVSQNGPKNLQPLQTIAAALHPEAYEGIDFESVATPTPVSCATPTPTASPTPTATATPADAGETTEAGDMATETATATETDDSGPVTPAAEVTTTTSDGGPGFTAVSALVAALVAALIARRRR